jgi:hypothetical protein
MTSFSEGDLVTVTGEHRDRDGIVFHVASRSKVLVAVPDDARGAVMRTFDPKVLAERTTDGAHDEALRMLIRRTPSAGRGDPRAQNGPGGGRSGHTRAPAHRATGR